MIAIGKIATTTTTTRRRRRRRRRKKLFYTICFTKSIAKKIHTQCTYIEKPLNLNVSDSTEKESTNERRKKKQSLLVVFGL